MLDARHARRPLCYRHRTEAMIQRVAGTPMRRRGFITLLGGAATWPLVAHAQQGERTRRIGVLSHLSENDPTGQEFVAAFRQRLQELGWVAGRNAGIDIRWG